MFEVADAGKCHDEAVFIGRGDRFIVFYRAAGLDNCGRTELCGFIDIVAERKKCVGGEGTALDGQFEAFGTHGGDADGIDTVHLSGTNA